MSDEIVDLVFSVTEVTTFDEVVGDTSVTSSWAGEFESPEEVVCLEIKVRVHKMKKNPVLMFTYSLEVWSNSENFVDQIFGGLDTNVSNVFVNDGVIRKGNSLTVDLAVSALVDQFTDSLQVWITPGDEWLSIRISTSNRIKRF